MAHRILLESFSDTQTTTEDLIAEGDKEVERYTYRGTNKGSFPGTPATGKKIEVGSMSIYRVANGKIVEPWGESDATGLMMQLGLFIAPPGAGDLFPGPRQAICFAVVIWRRSPTAAIQYRP